MLYKTDCGNSVSSGAIRREFLNAEAIRFLSRYNNVLNFRLISIGENAWWVKADIFLRAIYLDPQKLRDVFGGKETGHIDIGNKCLVSIEVDLPEVIYTIDYYKGRGFISTDESFTAFAKAINKPIEIWPEWGGTGGKRYSRTVYPSGTITEDPILFRRKRAA